MKAMKFTFVILYYNRLEYLVETVKNIGSIKYSNIELIVVDNNSDIDASNIISGIFKKNRYIRLDNNYGAVARNYGLRVAEGDYIICLDDDVVGIKNDDLVKLQLSFNDEKVAAVCFKVIEPEKGLISNWCHHYPKEAFSDKTFCTNEISEGAVCFRKRALDKVGLYYDKFFISHEGPDLACRLLDKDYDIVYLPDIVVTHHHSNVGREEWRRYYYDTRNTLWLCVRNYPIFTAIIRTLWGIVPMFIYSVRDGFMRFWFKGIIDSVLGLPEVLAGRNVISSKTLLKIKVIESNRPNLHILIMNRLFQKRVKI
jgi:GT2 family glycosyltransferase